MLLATGGTSSEGLVISLVNGHVRMYYRNLLRQIGVSNSTLYMYDDGELHTFQFTFIAGRIQFVIDGREQVQIRGGLGKLLLDSI